MAERQLQYVIKMMADDQPLRKQMAKWDWESILGADGKKLKDVLARDADAAVAHMNGLKIDWSQILGEKQIEQLEQHLNGVLRRNKQAIERFATAGNLDGISDVIKEVVGFGEEFSSLGAKFDAKSLTHTMGAFMKAAKPYINDAQAMEKAFGGLFDRMNAGSDSMSKSSDRVVKALARIDAVTKKSGGTDAYLTRLTKTYKELETMQLPDLSQLSLDDLEAKMDSLEDEWDKLESKFKGQQLNKEFKLERAKIMKQMLHVDDRIKQLGANPFYSQEDASKMLHDIQKAMEDAKELINSHAKTLTDAVQNAIREKIGDGIQIGVDFKFKTEDELVSTINDLICNVNKKTIDPIQVNYNLEYKSTSKKQASSLENIKNAISLEIDAINKNISNLEDAKKKYEHAVEEGQINNKPNKTAMGHVNNITAQLEELRKQKEANQYLLDNADDEEVQSALFTSLNNFKSVQKVIEGRQAEILSKTYDWRSKMSEALHFESGDTNIKISFNDDIQNEADMLYNAIQSYFVENEIELHINKESFINEIKAAVESGGVSIGSIGGGTGGLVDIHPDAIKAAVAAGVVAAFTGDTSFGTGTSNKQAQIVPENKAQRKVVYLDPDDPYMQRVADSVREVAKYVTDKAVNVSNDPNFKSDPRATKLKEFFDLRSPKDEKEDRYVNIEELAEADNMKIANWLGEVFEKHGTTLVSEFKTMMENGGRSGVAKDFSSILSELLYANNIKQVDLSEDERRIQTTEIFKDYAKKSSIAYAIGDILNTKNKNWKMPTIENLDFLLADISEQASDAFKKGNNGAHDKYKMIGNIVDTLKNARALVTDPNDESQKQAFMNAVENFRTGVQDFYDFMTRYLRTFEMDVDVKGYKKAYRVSGRRSLSSAMRAIGGNDANIENVHIYQDPSNKPLGVTRKRDELSTIFVPGHKGAYLSQRPDRTDILYKDVSIPDFEKPKEQYRRATAEDISGVTDARLDAARRAEEATARTAAAEEKNAKLAESNAAIEQSIVNNNVGRVTLEQQIAQNQQKINELSKNSKANERAQHRIQAAEEKLAVAKEAKVKAEAEQARVDHTDYSERDAALARIKGQEKVYNKWLKNPDNYSLDIYKAVFEPKENSYKLAMQSANDEIVTLTAKMQREQDILNDLRAQASESLAVGDVDTYDVIENEIDSANKLMSDYERKLVAVNKELETYNQKLQESRTIRKRETDEAKSKYMSEVQRFINGGYDVDGKPIGRLQQLEEERKVLGEDPRKIAKKQAEKATKDYEKALATRDKLSNTDEARNIAEISRLESENAVLKSRVASVKAEIVSLQTQQTQNKTASELLNDESKKTAVEDAIKTVGTRMEEMRTAQKKAEEVNKFVEDSYKKTETVIETGARKVKETLDRLNATRSDDDRLTEASFVKGTDVQGIMDTMQDADVLTYLQKKKYESTKDVYQMTDRRAVYLERLVNNRFNEGKKTLEKAAEQFRKDANIDKDQSTDDIIKKFFVEGSTSKTVQNVLADKNVQAYLHQRKHGTSKELSSLTPEMAKIFHAVEEDRKIINALSQDFGLDKYTTKDDLNAEIERRLSSLPALQKIDEFLRTHPTKTLGDSKDNEVKEFLKQKDISEYFNVHKDELENRTAKDAKISGLIREFYNKILTDGINVAKNYLQDTIQFYTNDLKTQEAARASLPAQDAESAAMLKQSVDTEAEQLKPLYQNAVSNLVQTVQEKIQEANKNGLDTNSQLLLVKEIQGLFDTIGNYVGQYKELFAEELLTTEQTDWINKERKNYNYSNSLHKETKNAEASHNLADSQAFELIRQREDLLKTRQSELLSLIAKGDDAAGEFEKELIGINQELAKYTKYYADTGRLANLTISNASLDTIFADDIEFANEYRSVLIDIIELEREADLKRAKGDSKTIVDAIYADINTKRSSLDETVYAKLQARQTSLLNDIKTAKTDGKSTTTLESSLQDVNKQLVLLELNKRRVEDGKLGGLLYNADVALLESYNAETKTLIEREYELALAKAKNLEIDKARVALQKQKRTATNRINTAKNEQRRRDAEGSPRFAALKYLAETEDTYQTALEQRYAIRRRKKYKEAELEAINDETKYQKSNRYRRDYEKLKESKILDYIGVDENDVNAQYNKDKKAANAMAEKQFSEWLVNYLEPIVKQHVQKHANETDAEYDKRYQATMQSLFSKFTGGSTAWIDMDPADLKANAGFKMARGFGTMREDYTREFKSTDAYTSLVAQRARQDEAELERRTSGLKAELDRNLDAIDKTTQQSIAFIRTATEQSYQPLADEMARVSSRVDIDKMQSAFADAMTPEIKKAFNQSNRQEILDGLLNDLRKLREDPKANAAQIAKMAKMRDLYDVDSDERYAENVRKMLADIARQNGANENEMEQLVQYLRNIGYNKMSKTGKWAPHAIQEIFAPIGSLTRDEARQNLIAAEEGRAQTKKNALQREYDTSVRAEKSALYAKTREAIDAAIDKYVFESAERWIKSAFTDDFLSKDHGFDLQHVLDTRKELYDNVVRGVVGKFKAGLEVRDGYLGDTNVREWISSRIAAEIGGLERYESENNASILAIERQRNAAMAFGGITKDEVADADVLKGQAALKARLESELEEQRKITEEIAALEKDGDPTKMIDRLNNGLERTKETIATLEMLIGNRDQLLEMQHEVKKDEQAAQRWDPEKQKLWYTNLIETARTKLDDEDESVRKDAETKIARYTEILDKINKRIGAPEVEEKKEPAGIVGALAAAIKEALGGAGGGLAVDATGLASENTANKIYETLLKVLYALGGSDIELKRDPEMEALLQEKRKLEAELKASASKSSGGTQQTTNVKKKAEEAVANGLITMSEKQLENEQAATVESAKRVENEKKATEAAASTYKLPTEIIINPAFDSKDNEIVAGTNAKELKQGQKDAYAKYIGGVGNYKVSDTIFSDKNALQQKVSELRGIINTSAEDSEEYLKAIVEISRLIATWREVVRKTNADVKDNEKWKQYLTSGDGKLFDKVEDVPIGRMNQNDIRRAAIERNTKISEDSKNTLFTNKEEKVKFQNFDDFKNHIQALSELIGNQVDGSEEQQRMQEQFIQALKAWATQDPAKLNGLNNVNPTAKEWTDYLIGQGVFSEIDTNKTPLTNRQLKKVDTAEDAKSAEKKADAKEREAAAETKITKEKNEQNVADRAAKEARIAEIDKLTKDYKPEVVKKDADGTPDSFELAKEKTLQGVLEAINKIAKNGVPKSGTKAANTDNKKRQKEEEVIKNRALQSDAAIRSRVSINNHGKLFEQYDSEVKELNKAESEVKASKKNEKADAIAKLKVIAARVEALGRNIIRNINDWDYVTAQSEYVEDMVATNNGKITKDDLEANAKKQANTQNLKYDFVGFDNGTLTYKLTDAAGNVRQLKMQWNELQEQVAITSDKSISALDPLVAEVNKYSNAIATAKQNGFLIDGADSEFEDAKKDIDDLVKKITEGKLSAEELQKAFDDLARKRQIATNIGAKLVKQAGTNEKMHTYMPAVGAVQRQHEKIVNASVPNSNNAMLKQYSETYNKLLEDYNKYVDTHQINDKKIQENLRAEALKVQALGQLYLHSENQVQSWRAAVEKSGVYTDKHGNTHALGGIKNNVTEDGSIPNNLRSVMANYLRQDLGLSDIENVRFNPIKQQLTASVRTSANTVAELAVQYDRATNSLYAYNTAEKESLTGIAAFVSGFKSKIRSIMQYTASITSIYRVISTLRQGVQYVKEIDAALTELRKVTDETEESYDKFLRTASKIADKVGSTTKEIVSSTSDWAKLGYSMEEAAGLAESTSVLLNVSEFQSIDEATSALTSTMQAFGYTAEQSMNVVDVMNEVGNNFAISSNGIATALQDSASALMTANNSYEEAVALVAAANRVVQDPNSVGSALRTISLRLRGTSVKELEEAGEDTEGAITSKSKLRGKIKTLSGVDILTDTGSYKSTYDILLEISEVWKDISDTDQAALLELIAGKNRANTAAAILSNTKDLEEAYKSALGAEGSAYAENEKYMDSIQGRIDQFTNAVQTLWSNTLDDSVIKTVVSFGTELIKLVDTLGVIPSVLAAIGATKGLAFLFKGFNISAIVTDIKDLTMGKAVLDKVTRQTTLSLMGEQIQFNLVNSALVQYAVKTGLATSAQVGQMTTTQLLTLSFKALGAAIMGALKAVVSFLFTNPVGWLILATGAVVGLVAAIDAVTPSTEELKEELSELQNTLISIRSELDSVNSELETTQKRMAELLSMPSLSFEEKEELSNLQKTNAELERRKALLTAEERRTAERTATKAAKTVDSYLNDRAEGDQDYYKTKAKLEDYIDNKYRSEIATKQQFEEMLLTASDEPKRAFGFLWEMPSEAENIRKHIALHDENISEVEEYIDSTLKELEDALDGVEYGYGADEQLDYVNNLRNKWEVIYGGDSAKTNAVSEIFNRKTYSDAYDEITKLAEKLQENPGDENLITKMRDQIKLAEEDIVASGITIEDALSYFTSMSIEHASDTMDGITNQYAKGIEVFEAFKNASKEKKQNTSVDLSGADAKERMEKITQHYRESLEKNPIDISASFEIDGEMKEINWNDLFTEDDEGEFKAQTDKIAEILKGCDEGTRSAFERLAEGVRNGQYDFDAAIQSFTASGLVEASKLIESQLSEMNSNIFKDVELSGVIDSFEEFRAALDDVANSMDILNTAQTQMNNAGRISVKTALDIIASTDKWNECLKIENGSITLNSEASKVLIQDKLDLAKANLQQALTTVEAQIAEIEATESSSNLAYTMEESTNMAVRSLAGNMAYLTKMMEAYTRIASGEAVDISDYIAQAQAAQKQVEGDLNYTKNAAQKIGTAELQKKKQELEAQLEMLEGIDTVDEFKNNYDFDKEPGDKYKDDDDEDALDKLKKKYERQLAMLDAQKQYLENEIARLEAENKPVSKSLYEEQIKIEEKKLKLYEQERKELLAQMNTVPKHSDDWWEMAEAVWETEHAIQESTLAIIEMNDAITQLYIDAFDKIGGAHDNKLTFFDDQKQYIEDYINYLETLGVDVPEEMYTKLIEVEEKSLAQNYEKLADLEHRFKEAEKNGLDETDEEWVRLNEDIRQVESAILGSKTAIAEFNKEMREADWENFAELMERVGDVESEIDHVAGLFDNEKAVNEDGTWTKEGVTKLGLHYQNMMSSEVAAEEYGKEIAKWQAEYEEQIAALTEEYGDAAIAESVYYARLQELKDGQWEAIETTESQKEAIIDLHEARVDEIENGIQKEIDAYNELIKVKKEELDAERDLHDFRNNIKDQTKDIATLERRIAAMSGSTDAATVAERTRLEAELRDKRESLDDTYYDHSMDSQSNAFDDEQESFEKSKNDYLTQLRQTLENAEFLMEGTMADILVNADTILNEIKTKADSYGVELSPKLLGPWQEASSQATQFKESAKTLLTGMTNSDGVIGMFSSTANGLIQAVFTINDDPSSGFTTSVSKILDALYTGDGSIAKFAAEASKAIKTPFSTAEGGAGTAASGFSEYVRGVLEAMYGPEGCLGLFSLYGSDDIVSPFDDGKTRAGLFGTEIGDLLAPMWGSNGCFGLFDKNVSDIFTGVFGAGNTAADGFKSHVATQIDAIRNDIYYNENPQLRDALNAPWKNAKGYVENTFCKDVEKALTGLVTTAKNKADEIDKYANDMIADMNRVQTVIDNTGGGPGDGQQTPPPPKPDPTPTVKGYRAVASWSDGHKTVMAQGSAKSKTDAEKDAINRLGTEYYKYVSNKFPNAREGVHEKAWQDILDRKKYSITSAPYYAKGTTGTTKDQWAITDEPQYGDELVLVPGKNGNLSYMRKGTAVIPADISENLMKLGMNPDFSNMSNGIKGINIMTNYVNKPEVKLDIENFLHVDNVSQDTMPELKKFVKEQVNSMVRQLNYGLKR